MFVLEEKDQIKERLGRSPDLADAYMQTYALPDLPANLVAQQRGETGRAQQFTIRDRQAQLLRERDRGVDPGKL